MIGSIGMHESPTVRLMSRGAEDCRLVETEWRVTLDGYKQMREVHCFPTYVEAEKFFRKAEGSRIDVVHHYEAAR